MKEDLVKPVRLLFYKRYVDVAYVRRKNNETDTLFNSLNSYFVLKFHVHWISKI